MDQVTQQNAATAEESASASEEMTAQAQTLLDLVSDLESQVGGSRNDKSQKTQVSSPSRQLAKNSRNGGHGKAQDLASESVIPMGANRIVEHGESFKDF